METIKLSAVKPADYNPRKISDEGFENLKTSLKTLGVIKPILVNADNHVLIAGHQRTRAMQEVGITECMAFILHGVKHHDECRFNQFHNLCEYEVSKDAPVIKITQPLEYGINIIEPKNMKVINAGNFASLNKQLAELVSKFGEFGLPISDKSGNIEISSAYALACRNVGIKMHCLVMPDEKIELAKYYLSKDYGEFCYDGLERHTYMQALAQMNRLRQTKRKTLHSRLYERLVIPFITKQENKALRGLDFGAGHYDYAKMLQSRGYNIHAIDPYHRENGADLSVGLNTRAFLKVCSDLDTHGQYDVVVCDSVLNSIDNIQSWYDVIFTCSALLKMGGHLFISGRPKTDRTDKVRCKVKTACKKNEMYFLDGDGLSANYRSGTWFFQKFDDDNQLKLIEQIVGVKIGGYKYAMGYGLHLQKTKELPLEKVLPSIMREFDMPLPQGRSYGLQEQIKQSITRVYNGL